MSKPLREIRIEDKEDEIGEAAELGPKDRARLVLAGWLLLGLFVLTLIAGGMIMWAPESRVSGVNDYFAFVKAVVPPLVTLVIGFYFNSQRD